MGGPSRTERPATKGAEPPPPGAGSPDLSAAARAAGEGVHLDLTGHPGADTDRFPDGYDPWRRRIGVRVRAVPDRGEANRAVCLLVAQVLGLPVRAVTVSNGATANHKTLHVQGLPIDLVRARLAEAAT